MLPTAREMETAFIACMRDGYGSKPAKDQIGDLPGSKKLETTLGIFRLVDFWFTTPHSDKSTGNTILYCDNLPVWSMHYGGWYDKDVIPFLKRCLNSAYVTEGIFYGGRGPFVVIEEPFSYSNVPRLGSSFLEFEGEERILNYKTRTFQGMHWYRGSSLLHARASQ